MDLMKEHIHAYDSIHPFYLVNWFLTANYWPFSVHTIFFCIKWHFLCYYICCLYKNISSVVYTRDNPCWELAHTMLHLELLITFSNKSKYHCLFINLVYFSETTILTYSMATWFWQMTQKRKICLQVLFSYSLTKV